MPVGIGGGGGISGIDSWLFSGLSTSCNGEVHPLTKTAARISRTKKSFLIIAIHPKAACTCR